jgi:hypothetical protein
VSYKATVLLLALIALIGCAECSLNGIDIPTYNLLLSERNFCLEETWAYFQKDLHSQTARTLPAYVTRYKARAASIVDKFDTAVCGQPATGGLLLDARRAVLSGYDSYLTSPVNQSLSPSPPAKSL